MPKLKPQTRFLLRGSALLVGLLSLWWFLLLSPMLYMLKGAAGAFMLIQENPSGDAATASSPTGAFHRFRHAAQRRDRLHLQPSGLLGHHSGRAGCAAKPAPAPGGDSCDGRGGGGDAAGLRRDFGSQHRRSTCRRRGCGRQVGSPVRRIPAGECAPLRDAVRGGAVAASRIACRDSPLEQRRGSASFRTSRRSRPKAAVEEAPPLTPTSSCRRPLWVGRSWVKAPD